MSPALQIVDQVLQSLIKLDLPHMLVGSFSSNAYGTPRSTQDLDVVMRIEADEVNNLLMHLGPDFQLDPQIGFETKLFTTKYLISVKDHAFKIEVFELSHDPHDQSRFQRRQTLNVAGHLVSIASPEDVVIQKLRWARAKDLEDVKGILLIQAGRLDEAYLEHWCRQHGSWDRLVDLRSGLR